MGDEYGGEGYSNRILTWIGSYVVQTQENILSTNLVVGSILLTNKNMAFSGASCIRFLIMYINWATEKILVLLGITGFKKLRGVWITLSDYQSNQLEYS